jgi:hypothetical protein
VERTAHGVGSVECPSRFCLWAAAQRQRVCRAWLCHGGYAYFGFVEVPASFKELDSWLRRRLRCYLWKQWGRRRYRELRRRGVSRDLAWNTVKSAHGPWRLSRSPALAIALPGAYFAGLGLPRLHRGASR